MKKWQMTERQEIREGEKYRDWIMSCKENDIARVKDPKNARKRNNKKQMTLPPSVEWSIGKICDKK